MMKPVDDYESPISKKKPYVMGFGKHYGESITEVPNTYLDWLLQHLEVEDWEFVMDKAEEEKKRRQDKNIYIMDEFEERDFERFERKYR